MRAAVKRGNGIGIDGVVRWHGLFLKEYAPNVERWHPLPGAQRRNMVKCSSKEGHVNSLQGSGLSSRVLFGAGGSWSLITRRRNVNRP